MTSRTKRKPQRTTMSPTRLLTGCFAPACSAPGNRPPEPAKAEGRSPRPSRRNEADRLSSAAPADRAGHPRGSSAASARSAPWLICSTRRRTVPARGGRAPMYGAVAFHADRLSSRLTRGGGCSQQPTGEEEDAHGHTHVCQRGSGRTTRCAHAASSVTGNWRSARSALVRTPPGHHQAREEHPPERVTVDRGCTVCGGRAGGGAGDVLVQVRERRRTQGGR